MSNIIRFVLILYISILSLEAKENKLLESQPQILFKHKDLQEKQKDVSLQVKFNHAVLLLQNKKYYSAIKLFKQTQQSIKIPSFLNIGIAWYKLGSSNNAYLYLKKIFDVKEAITQDPYSYMSATYYLYKITYDKKYMQEIIKISKKQKRLTQPTKSLVVDVYIELKRYKEALNMLKTMKYPSILKEALLYVKLKDWDFVKVYLKKALANAISNDIKNKILWIKLYADLKSNDKTNMLDDLNIIDSRKKLFTTYKDMPLKLFFNKNKYSAEDYFKKITKFDLKTKIDFIFYFVPYIFIDKDALNYAQDKTFLLDKQIDTKRLNQMMQYNKKFLQIIKKDPIQRAYLLQKDIDKKYDVSSYEYYNLAICYAQIDNFNKAYHYFHKAYGLNKGNSLFAVMTLLSATRINHVIPKQERRRIVKNVLSKHTSYQFFAQYVYKIIYSPKKTVSKLLVKYKYKKSIFFRALYFLNHINKTGILEDEPLLLEFSKDPLVYLLKLNAREKKENDYQYIARLQDNIPKEYNNLFIKGPLIIVRYYIQTLKALGMFHSVNINIYNDKSATYYRTKALVDLYNNKPLQSIKIITKLQKQYNLNDRYTYLLLIAALIDSKQYNEAALTLSIAKQQLYKDSDIDFLIGLNLLKELKLMSSRRYLRQNYNNNLIDYYIKGFDKLLLDI